MRADAMCPELRMRFDRLSAHDALRQVSALTLSCRVRSPGEH
jgi:hypothetical protein